MSEAPVPARLGERLSGKRVLLTGVTGFVGEALLHRLLSQAPETTIVVLVRPKGSARGIARITQLLGKPIFADLVAAAGSVDELAATRLQVVEGDLAAVPELPRDLDAVVHCAGDVSFDPPVDEAFATNIVGTRNLLDRLAEVGDHVHYVHISTAYVAGRRRGAVPEGPVDHDVDLEAELAWGLAQHDIIANRSRTADMLARLRREAEREHGRAGPLSSAHAAEQRRRDWVREELVRTGTERARSLGWTDCYTFTKALGERVVEQYATHAPVSVVRPSIIESAIETPHPGWIEGFKMAEPVILAYGRGELPEFPAPPDSTIDIVPVDHVVAAIIAVLGAPPEPGSPRWYHVSSSDRNPLSFEGLYSIVRDYFDHHPFEIGDRGAARLPEWRFPGAQHVERLLVTSERAHKVADYVITHAPRHDRTREMARKLEQQRRRLEFLRRYLDLYREYTQTELRFSDVQTMTLLRSLHPDDQRELAFDTGVIDWPYYMGEVHIPAVTAPIRRLDELRRRRRGSSAGAMRTIAEGDEGADSVAAVFDMDGTLLELERRRDVPVDAAARSRPGREDDRDRPSGGAAARHDPRRAPRTQRLPSAGLPRVRRSPHRGPRRDRRSGAHLPRPRAAVPGRHPAHPAAPGGRPPDDPRDRRDLVADPAAHAALRPHRGRAAGGEQRRDLHRLPGEPAARRGVTRGLAALLRFRRMAST